MYLWVGGGKQHKFSTGPVEVRGQLRGSRSLLLLGTWWSDSDCQSWWQVPLFPEPSHWPTEKLFDRHVTNILLINMMLLCNEYENRTFRQYNTPLPSLDSKVAELKPQTVGHKSLCLLSPCTAQRWPRPLFPLASRIVSSWAPLRWSNKAFWFPPPHRSISGSLCLWEQSWSSRTVWDINWTFWIAGLHFVSQVWLCLEMRAPEWSWKMTRRTVTS